MLGDAFELRTYADLKGWHDDDHLAAFDAFQRCARHAEENRYKDGGLSDLRVFARADGLTWLDPAGRTFTLAWAELKDWIGERAQAGSMAPKGFPRSNKFGPAFG